MNILKLRLLSLRFAFAQHLPRQREAFIWMIATTAKPPSEGRNMLKPNKKAPLLKGAVTQVTGGFFFSTFFIEPFHHFVVPLPLTGTALIGKISTK